MKQTAVEYVIEQLQAPCRGIPSHIIEQAKLMEKQQIIDAFYQCGRDNFEHIKVINRSATDYYNETYGSKSTSSQTEISDDEIEKKAQQINLKYGSFFSYGFIMAIKWYREQLK